MYLVMELQKNEEGAVSSIVTDHPTPEEAESKFYAILSSAAVSDVSIHSAVIVSDEGFPLNHKCYRHGAAV